MIQDVLKDANVRMGKSVEALRHELTKLRTGRAHTSLLDHVTVEYYGSEVPLSQVANVSVEDSRTLTVSPWEKSMVPVVEKAIINSDLGLTPSSAGTVIRSRCGAPWHCDSSRLHIDSQVRSVLVSPIPAGE